ncbi:MAG TPA: hypothetical protein VFM18_01530 [Methanosarcina sp.]|nr:hypothetical protein [Methanosarcina sp.]
MTPQSAKSKGRRLQQLVRDAILATFPNLEPDDVKSTGMGQSGEDVQLSPAARRLLPFQIECKNKAKSQVHTYYEQAKTHGKHEPLVIVKMDYKKPLAVLDLEIFLELVKKANNNNENQCNNPQ